MRDIQGAILAVVLISLLAAFAYSVSLVNGKVVP